MGYAGGYCSGSFMGCCYGFFFFFLVVVGGILWVEVAEVFDLMMRDSNLVLWVFPPSDGGEF